MDLYVEGRRVVPRPEAMIGAGGEAEIYDLGDSVALKLFKPPTHPDFQGRPTEQQAARERLHVHQRKLPAFPLALPPQIVQPRALATDRRGRHIAGYTMRLIGGAVPLLRYNDPGTRPASADQVATQQAVVTIFRKLHDLIARSHHAGMVIGDLNDLNVLIVGGDVYLIDVDSWAFGPYPSTQYTARFVDPLACEAGGHGLIWKGPHTQQSDWYAFAVMLMEGLLGVHPYGGVYRPANKADHTPPDLRPLKRITIFHPDVRYPKQAPHYTVLPDALLDYLHGVLADSRRNGFPVHLLDTLRWQRCPACALVYARDVCPQCTQPAAATVLPPVAVVRGAVSAKRVFHTTGAVLAAAFQDGALRWISQARGSDVLTREDGGTLSTGLLRVDGAPPRFSIQGAATLVAASGQLLVFQPGKPVERASVDHVAGGAPIFDANTHRRYWLGAGRLLRDGLWGVPEAIGEVLAGQTRFWVGEHFGFGFWRAGHVSFAFVFDAARRGLRETAQLAIGPSEIVDATCAFAAERCWFFMSTREGSKLIYRCAVLRPDGTVIATAEAERGDGSWLGTLHGKCAAQDFLLAPTDEGVVRVEIVRGQIVPARSFRDTEPWVHSASQLFPAPGGLYVVDRQEIRLLTWSPT